MRASRSFVGVGLAIIALGLPITLASRGLNRAPPPAESLRVLIDLQETHADVTVRWFYTPPTGYTTWYKYWVEDEAAEVLVIEDSTSLQTTQFTIQRAETDKAYQFAVVVVIEDALGGFAESDPFSERFIIPARAPAGLLAKRDMVTTPVIVANDPAFETASGTVWLEFEGSDMESMQGLWSRDANGYDGGGHLSVWVEAGSVHTRIQTTDSSVVLQWPVVRSQLNQVAVEFGEDTGFRLHVNGALAMSESYTGGTIGNTNDLVVGASKQNARPDDPTWPEWSNPFSGNVRVSEFYTGRYDFSGRWGLPPIPPPPPVDSLSIEVANIDHGQVVPLLDWGGTPAAVDYFVVRFTPIQEAEYIVRLVDGDTLDYQGVWQEAKLPVAGGPWRVSCSGACKSDSSWRGWEMYNEDTGASCSARDDGWTTNGTAPCVTKAEIIAGNERNNDCIGGRYWAKHGAEIECNFNIKSALSASFVFPRGTNPVLRFEVFNARRERIGYWERRVA